MKHWVTISVLLFSSQLALAGQLMAAEDGDAAASADGTGGDAAAAPAADAGDAAAPVETAVCTAEKDKTALLAFYEALGGDQWDKGAVGGSVDPWDPATEPCGDKRWFEVDCEAGNVVSISLNFNNLVGTIPSEIEGLACLRSLNLDNNQIDGRIPASITKLSKLESLQLKANKLEGEIPSGLADMANLNSLDLRFNALHLAADAPVGTETSLMQKHQNVDFLATQTLDAKGVQNLKAVRTRDTLTLEWTQVDFAPKGGYRIYMSESYDGEYTWHKNISGIDYDPVDGEVPDKSFTKAVVNGLAEGARYYFKVRSFTDAHPDNLLNKVISDGLTGDIAVGVTDSEDSDLDGLTNDVEDQIGTFKDIPDSDGDGIWDGAEVNVNDLDNIPNTDGDAFDDPLDPDDDNDGVPTRREVKIPEDPGKSAQFIDTDGDGINDHRDADDDNDGVPTAVETDNGEDIDKDTDGDGTPNYLDTDDDGDGISTFDETNGGKDITKDSDDDGIPDYLDNKNDKVAVLEDTADVVDTSIGGGSMSLGIAAAGLLGVLRRRRRLAITAAAITPLLMLSGMAGADEKAVDEAKAAAQQELDKAKGKVEKKASGDATVKKAGLKDEKIDFKVTQAQPQRGGRIYLGLGAGLTTLQPEPKTPGVTVSDDNSTGYKFLFGYEATDHLAIEAMVGALGEATLSPSDKTVDYKVGSLFALYNLFDYRVGLNPIIKVGVSSIQNSSDTGIDLNEIDDTTLSAGVGLEYEFGNGFVIRGEYEYYAEDAQMASINVLKRMGGEAPIVIPAPAPEPVVVPPPAPAPTVIPAPSVKVEFSIPDTDGDGVNDIRDACPNTPAGAEVDEVGCAKFQGVLKGVNFEYNSSRLTPRARAILEEVAAELKNYPNVKVQVEAHTDSKGSSGYNLWLSKARAQSVIDFLVSRGISARRLIPIGFGETKPIASNKTDAGRALNRRVEFKVLSTR